MQYSYRKTALLVGLTALLFTACTSQQDFTQQQRPVTKERPYTPSELSPPSASPSSTPQTSSTDQYASNPLRPTRSLSMPTTPAPSPKAKAIAVFDAKTGKLIYGHNAHSRRQVASTQKVMTALTVIDAGRLDDYATITSSDLKTPRIRMDLRAGDRYKRRDLLRAMLTASYNDVATTLARDTAGSVSAFMARVNARAGRMGMHNSHFVNPHGLPGQQYSTAYDMGKAGCWAFYNPLIRSIVDVPHYQFTLSNGKTRRVNNTNKLLRKHPWVNGMKTGYTNAAGRCLISTGSMNGEAVVVVVLGIAPSQIWGESLKYLKWALKLS